MTETQAPPNSILVPFILQHRCFRPHLPWDMATVCATINKLLLTSARYTVYTKYIIPCLFRSVMSCMYFYVNINLYIILKDSIILRNLSNYIYMLSIYTHHSLFNKPSIPLFLEICPVFHNY